MDYFEAATKLEELDKAVAAAADACEAADVKSRAEVDSRDPIALDLLSKQCDAQDALRDACHQLIPVLAADAKLLRAELYRLRAVEKAARAVCANPSAVPGGVKPEAWIALVATVFPGDR